MTILKCDHCKKKTKELTKYAVDGFIDVELCDNCSDKFNTVISDWEEKAEELRKFHIVEKLSLDIEPDEPIVEEHEHEWSTGWISNDRKSRILHQLCTFERCEEKLESAL